MQQFHWCAIVLLAAGGRRGNPLAIWFALGIVLLTLVPLLLIIVAASRREKKRTAALKLVADSLGFEFVPKENADYLTVLKELPVFARFGRRQQILNLMRGRSRSIEVTIFDHSYVVSAGEHSHTRRQSMICFTSESLSLPDFTLAPKRFWNKIGGFFGQQNIEFDTHPVFSDNFVVRGSDPEAVRAMFHDLAIEYFEENPGWNAEASPNRFLLYRANKRLQPDEIPTFFEEGLKVLSLLRGRT